MKKIKIIVFLLFVGSVLILGSCGNSRLLSNFGGAAESKTADKRYTEEPGMEKMMAVEDTAAFDMEESTAPREPDAGADMNIPETTGGEGSTGTETAASTVKPKEEERKRVYSGYAELVVDDVDAVKMELTDIAENSGGYVEGIVDNTMTIRVPAEDFASVFLTVQKLGDVLDAYEETVDVTEYYSDLEARLQIAEETRTRLYELLERTEDVEERIKILREIRRLTEEIERINLSFEVLKKHIAFSRISVMLNSRLDYEAGTSEAVPFPWIDDLHPLYPAARKLRGRVAGDLPDQFAVFKKDKYYHAETAEGARLRISTVRNKPEGDADFWIEALEHHLTAQYKTASQENYGEIRGILFTAKDKPPYYYFVGVKPDKRNLHVIELFFPTPETYETGYEDVVAALKEIRVK